MSRNRTDDEVEKDYLKAMGEELGQLFHRLYNQCVWLHWKWKQFEILFGTNPERIELLNGAAPVFFRIVQDSLWEDVLLHICRLTDPPKSAGKSNLTVQRLPSLVASEARDKIQGLLDISLQKCEFARDWRRRHIAHLDLDLALRRSAEPLAPASRRSVVDAIETIAQLLNSIDMHYRNSSVAYHGFGPIGDAESLLYVIRDGLEADAEQRARFESGKPLPRDYEPRRAV